MTNQIMRFFEYEHLPAGLKEMSAMVATLATAVDTSMPDSAEKSAGLRKLLEAKDCFVRAVLVTMEQEKAESVGPKVDSDPRKPDPNDFRYSLQFGMFSVGDTDDSTPVIHLFSNSKTGNGEAMALAEDGSVIAFATCSSRAYLRWDLHDDPDSLVAAKVRGYYGPNHRIFVHPVDDPTPPAEVLDRMWAKLNAPPEGSAMEGDLVEPHDHPHPHIHLADDSA